MNDKGLTFGSVCSGVEAAQLAFTPLGFEQVWSSEIAEFPCKVLEHHYPFVDNVGDMTSIPGLIVSNSITAPDIFCGGTPCQAFSLAGWQNGLEDKRGQLTITFIDIANAIDAKRKESGKDEAVILWENVEGVLNDKTNAFGSFISGLAGLDETIKVKKWSKAGYLNGPQRNVAWRVIDAKHFGVPQQRKRLYVVAGSTSFRPDHILFEIDKCDTVKHQSITKKSTTLQYGKIDLFSSLSNNSSKRSKLTFLKGDDSYQVFREYTDCLYAAYGTKWNGNAAAYNGSLYVAQNDRLRRFTPLECERLMGFPDNYTLIEGNSDTRRYQAIGNSWAVPVIEWIGARIKQSLQKSDNLHIADWTLSVKPIQNNVNANLYMIEQVLPIDMQLFLNASAVPNEQKEYNLEDIVQGDDVREKFYLTPQACRGILRRKHERDLKMNLSLESLMHDIGFLRENLKAG